MIKEDGGEVLALLLDWVVEAVDAMWFGCAGSELRASLRGFLATRSAPAEEGQVVDAGVEAVAVRDRGAEGGDQAVFEFAHRAAVAADEVMMAAVAQFEVADAAAEIGFADEPEVAEQFERAIDGGAIDAGQGGGDPGQEVVGRDVFAGPQRGEDRQALGGGTLPKLAQEGCPVGRGRPERGHGAGTSLVVAGAHRRGGCLRQVSDGASFVALVRSHRNAGYGS